jgi:succinate dehydrogenase/fumarate reductase flavoprotein subunit
MTTWHDYLKEEGQPPSWPYPTRFEEEQEVEADVLVIGGGIAGCWAAISAARTGVKVVLLEKGDTVRSGAGGPGCDHWCNVPANPHSRVDPDEWAEHMADAPYSCGIGLQIQCREDWDTLLEMEQMGGKIRDTDDEYVGAEGRYDDTKLMISPRYGVKHNLWPEPGAGEPGFNPPEERSNVVIRIWGSTFKPALKKECKRLGVQVMDRIAGTSLLTEKGVQGGRVVGATGLNSRTGEFVIVKSKATIISTGGAGDLWLMNTELCGMSSMHPRTWTGEGLVMAFKAGAEITNLEMSMPIRIATGLKHKWYSGAGDASYENVPIVDANGKRVPYPIQGWEDAGAMIPAPDVEAKISEDVKKGVYELPFYGDFPGMSDVERRSTWNLMLGEESTTKIIMDTFNQAGYDESRDLLQSYKFIEGAGLPQWRNGGGNFMMDWNLKTNLDGLYVAGTQMVGAQDHSYCAATGRYAGRKAAAYVKEVAQGKVSRDQIQKEKERIYAPTRRDNGIEWKEFHAGIARINQYYNSEYKTENLFKMGLGALERMEKEFAPQLYALDPHKLLRTVEDLTMLEHSKMIMQASLARKASRMGFMRIDYPEMDPPEWNKFLIAKLENDKFTTSLKEQRFWGNMKEQYEKHNKDYTGVYQGQ